MSTSKVLHVVSEEGSLVNQEAINEFLGVALENNSTTTSPKTPKTSTLLRLKAQGIKYHVISIFGGQSSGKSTLLNALFNTPFEIMNEEKGRSQTTKGAFLAPYLPPVSNDEDVDPAAQAPPPLFVMDCEGTDGLERGEDQSFERQLSLFALSVADVLVINMNELEVGRNNAANMPLLRTIFEVNLQLFSHDLQDEKPTLLIVIRDFSGSDLQKLSQSVLTSLSTMWDSIAKPAGLEKSTIQSVFNVRFHGLPHFRYQRDKFDEEVVHFRRWFNDPLSPKYLFHSTVSYRHIPLEVLAPYFESCWHSITQSKDLDIPTQRDLVARHRCGELFEQSMRDFQVRLEERSAAIQRGDLLPNLEGSLHAIQDALESEFVSQAKLYSRKIVAEFIQRIKLNTEQDVKRLVDAQTEKMVSECMRQVDDNVQSIVDDALKELLSCKDILSGKATAADGVKYVNIFWESIVKGVRQLELDLARGEEKAAFGRYQALIEQDAVARERCIRTVSMRICEKVRVRVASMSSDACGAMMKGFDYVLTHKEDGSVRFFSTTTGLQNVFPAARLAGLFVLSCIFYFRLTPGDPFASDEDSLRLQQNSDEEKFYLHIPTYGDGDALIKYPDFTSMLSSSKTKRNKQVKDEEEDEDEENGYESDTMIASKSQTTRSISSLVDGGFTAIDPSNIIMSKAAVRRAFELYSQQIQFSVTMQLRTIENSQQNIPSWVWLVILVLGHNEFYYILTSPVLLIFIIAVVYFFFSSWIVAQWHRFEETGPQGVVLGIKTGIAILSPYLEQVKQRTTAAVKPLEETKKDK